MTQSAPEQNDDFTQEDLTAAQAIEQPALTESQNKYLLSRVVVLRAALISTQKRAAELERKLSALMDPGEGDEKDEPSND